MTRYVVKVAAGERTVSLLVVLSSSQLCSALLDAVKARLPTVASKLGLTDTDNLQITLHLNEIDGPILDFEDLLCDVIHYSDEVCFAVIQVSHLTQVFLVVYMCNYFEALISQYNLENVPGNPLCLRFEYDLIC